VGGHQTLALATAAMVSVEPEAPQGPPAPSVQPCRLLTFSPIKIPVLASPLPGKVTPGGTDGQRFVTYFAAEREFWSILGGYRWHYCHLELKLFFVVLLRGVV